MTNEIVIEELNTLLRGNYMGIRSYEHYIQKVNDEEMKKVFQEMQQELKHNAMKLAERIQNLGGVPASGEGFSGSMHSFMHKMMVPNDERAILRDAIEGLEKYGVDYSEELVKGDLDAESKRIAEEVINDSRRQAELLKQLLH